MVGVGVVLMRGGWSVGGCIVTNTTPHAHCHTMRTPLTAIWDGTHCGSNRKTVAMCSAFCLTIFSAPD
jgi:hypothetical protein